MIVKVAMIPDSEFITVYKIVSRQVSFKTVCYLTINSSEKWKEWKKSKDSFIDENHIIVISRAKKKVIKWKQKLQSQIFEKG